MRWAFVNCSPDLPHSQGLASHAVCMSQSYFSVLSECSLVIFHSLVLLGYLFCACVIWKTRAEVEKWRGVQKIKVSLWDGRFIELVSQRLESHTLLQKHLVGCRTLRTAALLVLQKHPTPDMPLKGCWELLTRGKSSKSEV